MSCEKLICYLSNDARIAYEKLLKAGIDRELAFTMVESLGGEEVYCLDDDSIEVGGASNEQQPVS
jgi:hypothetical protein